MKKETVVEVKPIELATVRIKIKGITSLIMHCWSEKAKKEMLDAMMGTKDKSKKKAPKNPVGEFIDSMYWISPKPEEPTAEAFDAAIAAGARFGFPVTAFKQAACSAAYRKEWIPNKMALRGAFFIIPDAKAHDGSDVVEIFSDEPTMLESNVKVGMGSADLRYRGCFDNWSAYLTLQYDVNGAYSVNDLINFINAAGFVCGVGEWRPERDGQNGMFAVAME